ncbi:MAG: peptidase S9, partial [Bacteroidetes bacterium]|nr:peptidase S9 [Bacteroidota bacterium]
MKNFKSLFLAATITAVLFSCNTGEKQPVTATTTEPVIGKPEIQLTSDLMTPEVLWAFGRVSGNEVSPDGQTVLYGISYYSIELNKGNRELYAGGVNGGETVRLTHSPKSEFNEIWRPDGKKIGYLSSESGSVQLWEMNPDGSGKSQITNIAEGITGFKYSPDQTMILFTKDLPVQNKFEHLYKGLPKATGRINDDLMYRHWDHWIDTYSHVYFAAYSESLITEGKDIQQGEAFDSPLPPFGGIEQIDWTADSKG